MNNSTGTQQFILIIHCLIFNTNLIFLYKLIIFSTIYINVLPRNLHKITTTIFNKDMFIS